MFADYLLTAAGQRRHLEDARKRRETGARALAARIRAQEERRIYRNF